MTSEKQTSGGQQIARTVEYTYDGDSNRKTMTYPSGSMLRYDYTSRNQLSTESDANGALVNYTYDLSGNRRTRAVNRSSPPNAPAAPNTPDDLGYGSTTTYTPDALNRPLMINHDRGGTSFGRFDYNYDKVGRIDWMRRDSFRGDRYDYYLDDQLKTAAFDAYNPANNAFGATNITTLMYDAAGNRTSQTNSTSTSYSYGANDLNQYNSVSGSAVPAYDAKGNLTQYNDSIFVYDAQNPLHQASKGANTVIFYHDAQGRQILRNVNGQWIYSVWDGWNLLEEYDINGQLIHSYVHGAATDEMVLRYGGGAERIWYSQDGQGNTTHLTNDYGTVIESYKYPPANSGAPSIYNASGPPISSSAYDNRFLYTGREYYKEGAIYDYRNRFYLPSLGRFLQPDPIGFAGDSGNLYRYCGNDPVNSGDPSGLNQYSVSVGAGPAVMITWGTNGSGQRNFGYYLGVGAGLSASYTPSDSGYAFPQVVPGIAGQFNEGAGRFMSVNVSVLVTNGDSTATATAGIGYKNFERQVGVTIDPSKSPPYSAAPTTYSYLNGIFVGIGGTSYGAPQVPAPGGTTFVDPSGCQAPECVTTERVTVYGSAVSQPNYLVVGQTYFNANGSPFHLGTTGNLINGRAFTVTNWFQGLTSSGGGDWQTVGYFPSGGEPGEGSWAGLVSPDKY